MANCHRKPPRWKLELHLSLGSLIIRLPVLASSVTCHPATGTGSRAERAVVNIDLEFCKSVFSFWGLSFFFLFFLTLIEVSLSFSLFLSPPFFLYFFVHPHTHTYTRTLGEKAFQSPKDFTLLIITPAPNNSWDQSKAAWRFFEENWGYSSTPPPRCPSLTV